MNIHTSEPFLQWLLQHFSYHTVLMFKTYATDIACFILGIIFTVFITAFVFKNSRMVIDEDAEPGEISITKMNKHNKNWMLITSNPATANNLPLVTATIVFTRLIITKLFPFVKEVLIVNKRSVRTWFTVMTAIIILLCVFFITFDSHVILPDKDGDYVVKKIAQVYSIPNEK